MVKMRCVHQEEISVLTKELKNKSVHLDRDTKETRKIEELTDNITRLKEDSRIK